ncbi:MAG TPA: hypothetical protein VIM61_07210 [Chthoniobacterales bacterium]
MTSPLVPSFRVTAAAALLGACFSSTGIAGVTYDVRAKTGDKVKAWILQANVGYVQSKVRQGSFGAPSINDKGSVGYACILAGTGLSSFRNNSVLVRKSGKKSAKLAIQAGYPNVVSDTFLPPVGDGATHPYPGSGTLYRISENVAINNKDRVGFAGQLLYILETVTKDKTTYKDTDTAVYGTTIPKGSGFRNVGLSGFISYFDGIKDVIMSINKEGSVTYGADFLITADKSVPGFAFSSPNDYGVIATTDANVIGLPYPTTFQSFSNPVIADNNVAYVVADISDTGDSFDGIWQGNNPDLQPVVVKNSAAPGGGSFTDFDGTVGPSRNGKLCAFIANVSGGSVSRAVYRANSDGSGLKQIAAVGSSVTANDGVKGAFSSLQLAAANNLGRVVILGSVSISSGGNSYNPKGVWVSDNSGDNLTPIAVVGQSIKIGTKSKQIEALSFNPMAGINSKGQVSFTASFKDRTSAVIVATP